MVVVPPYKIVVELLVSQTTVRRPDESKVTEDRLPHLA